MNISDILPHYVTCNKCNSSHELSCDVIVQWTDYNTLLACQMPFTSCHFINQLLLVLQANQLAALAGRASVCLLGWSGAAITPHWNTASTCSEQRWVFFFFFAPREKHQMWKGQHKRSFRIFFFFFRELNMSVFPKGWIHRKRRQEMGKRGGNIH